MASDTIWPEWFAEGAVLGPTPVTIDVRLGPRSPDAVGVGDGFWFDRSARAIVVDPSEAGEVSHTLLDQVLPRVLGDLGHLMVHGSAVDTPRGAVAFIGASGRGKSTLAAHLHASGFELLTDDCFCLTVDDSGVVHCTPTYRSLRLWPDVADQLLPGVSWEAMEGTGGKRRILLGPASVVDPRPLAGIFHLEEPGDSGEIWLTAMAPAEAVVELLANCFRLDVNDPHVSVRMFDQCAAVVDRLAIVRLDYPREPEVLTALVPLVLAQLEGPSHDLEQPPPH